MSKNCSGCGYFVQCWEDSWNSKENYCIKDNEYLTPKKEGEKSNE